MNPSLTQKASKLQTEVFQFCSRQWVSEYCVTAMNLERQESLDHRDWDSFRNVFPTILWPLLRTHSFFTQPSSYVYSSKTSPYWTFLSNRLSHAHCKYITAVVCRSTDLHTKKQLRIHKIHMRTVFMCVVGACHICQGSMSSPTPIVFYFGQTGVGGCINCNVCGPEIPTGISKELRGLGWQPCGDRNQQLQRHRPPLIPSLLGSIFALTASGIKWKRRQGPDRSAVKAQQARRHNESCVQERDAASKTWTIKPLGNRLLNSCTLWFMGPTLIHLCIV